VYTVVSEIANAAHPAVIAGSPARQAAATSQIPAATLTAAAVPCVSTFAASSAGD
jgi:hypothetical protein